MKNIIVAIYQEKNIPLLISKAEEMAGAFGSKLWILQISERSPEHVAGLEAGPQFARDNERNRSQDEPQSGENVVQQLQEKEVW